jgi:pimeloyl-ACP methyl ester carboxylesterase
VVRAGNGVDYTYRESGARAGDDVPLILLQHCRGNLGNWDPALIDALALGRHVITFDNAGVGGSTEGMDARPTCVRGQRNTGGLQRDKVTHAGTHRKRPASRDFAASGALSQRVAGDGFEPS